MSGIKYGLISKIDAECIEATLNYVMSDFPNEVINVTEVGCYAGESGNAFSQYIKSKKRIPNITGIDNNKDGEKLRFDYDKLIIGNSAVVYNQLENNSQHLVFIDGDHSLIGVISDFFAYADKVKIGGYLVFHDTGKHIEPCTGFQHGDKYNPDAYISVRKALDKLGLIYFSTQIDKKEYHTLRMNWKIIFDEADKADEAGGVCVFKKLFS